MEVFINKIDEFIEKFYKSQSENSILKIEIEKIKKELDTNKSDGVVAAARIQSIENYIENIKTKNNNSESFWGKVIDFLIKILYVLVVSYILYQLGIQNIEVSP